MLPIFLGGQILIVGLLAFVALALTHSFDSARMVRERLNQTFGTRAQSQQILAILRDAETAERDYVITGNVAALAPYTSGMAQLNESIEAFRKQQAGQPETAERIANFEALVDARVALLAEAIDARRNGEADRAAEIVAAPEGKRLMDDARAVITDIRDEEEGALSDAVELDSAASARSRRVSYSLLFIIAGFSIFGSALTFVLLDRRRQAEMAADRDRAMVKNLSDIADASNQSTFETALKRVLDIAVVSASAPWGLTVRLDRSGKHPPVANWLPAPQGDRPGAIVSHVAALAARLTEPALVDLPPSLGLGIPACVLIPIKDGTGVAGALVIANPGSRFTEAKRQAGRLFTMEQVSRAAERQRILDSLNDALARHEALFTSASEGIVSINESNTIERFNPAAEAMFGYRADEAERRDFGILLDEAAGPANTIAKRLLDGPGAAPVVSREVVARRQDGSTFPAEMSLSMTALEDRKVFVAFVRDISERKKIERMQTEFVSTVSHELRTPLTSIGGALGLIAGGAAGEITPGAKRLIDIAHTNSQRLIRLVNDILDIEKLESGRMVFQFAPVPVDEVIGQVIAANLAYAQTFGVEIRQVGVASAVTVNADADRLNQAVTNLVSNAVKFSPAGAAVDIRVEHGPPGIRISVTDRGPGIPEEFRSRIFGRFSQADSSDTRQKGGSGLGLSIAQEIAKRHSGSISFETELGRGTVFHLDLPAELPAQHGPIRAPAGGGAHRILVCANDEAAAKSICATLSLNGFLCAAAFTLEQCLDELAKGGVRVAVIDVRFADAEISSLVRALRDGSGVIRLPVVLLSLTADGSMHSGSYYGLPVMEWITRTSELERLPELVRNLLEGPHLDKPRILHVEDDRDVLEVVRHALQEEFHVLPAPTLEMARQRLARETIDLVILDLTLLDGLGTHLLPALVNSAGHPIPTIVFTAQDAAPDIAEQVEMILTKSRGNLSTLVEAVRSVLGDHAPRPGEAEEERHELPQAALR